MQVFQFLQYHGIDIVISWPQPNHILAVCLLFNNPPDSKNLKKRKEMRIPNWIKDIERYTTETWFVLIKLTPTWGIGQDKIGKKLKNGVFISYSWVPN